MSFRNAQRGQGLVSYACVPCFFMLTFAAAVTVAAVVALRSDSVVSGLLAGVGCFVGMVLVVSGIPAAFEWWYRRN